MEKEDIEVIEHQLGMRLLTLRGHLPILDTCPLTKERYERQIGEIEDVLRKLREGE